MAKARGVLINVTGGPDLSLAEVNEAVLQSIRRFMLAPSLMKTWSWNVHALRPVGTPQRCVGEPMSLWLLVCLEGSA